MKEFYLSKIEEVGPELRAQVSQDLSVLLGGLMTAKGLLS